MLNIDFFKIKIYIRIIFFIRKVVQNIVFIKRELNIKLKYIMI